MGASDILASIDHEIAQLQRARALLGGVTAPAANKKAGRPRKVAGRPKKVAAAPEKVAIVAPVAAKPGKRRRGTSLPRGGNGSSRLSKSAGRRRRLLQ
jgi:hypothetical protein